MKGICRGVRKSCGCCSYPHGRLLTIGAQASLVGALTFSVASLADCQFVRAAVDGVPELYPGVESIFNGELRGLGYFTFEDQDKKCFYEFYDFDIAEWYFDVLGGEWRVARILASLTASLALLLWFWSLSFSCAPHPQRARYILAILLVVLLPTIQLFTFAGMTSSFCNEHGCEMGRSANFSIVAGGCFVISGIFFALMRDRADIKAVAGDASTDDQEEQENLNVTVETIDASEKEISLGGEEQEEDDDDDDVIFDVQEMLSDDLSQEERQNIASKFTQENIKNADSFEVSKNVTCCGTELPIAKKEAWKTE